MLKVKVLLLTTEKEKVLEKTSFLMGMSIKIKKNNQVLDYNRLDMYSTVPR